MGNCNTNGKKWRTKKQIKASLFINRRGRRKMNYFSGLQTRAYGKGGKEEEDRERSSQGMDT